MITARGDRQEIVEEITIAATPHRVYQALITPGELMDWWTEPGVCIATEWQLDARVGGQWLSRWRWEDGREFAIGGTVLQMEPPSLLVYDWWDERYPELPRTRVRYDLRVIPDGTRVRVTHSGFAHNRVDLADYGGGWSRVLDKIAIHTTLNRR